MKNDHDADDKKRKPKLGSGGRFKQLKGKLAAKGAKNPGALAAFIGRKKYGNKKMASMAAKGKAKRSAPAPKGAKNPFGNLKTDKLGRARGSQIYPNVLSKTSTQNKLNTGKTLLKNAMRKLAKHG